MSPLSRSTLDASRFSRIVPTRREPSMGEVITIGLDIVKSVFQVHGVDDAGAGSDPQACQLGENVILLAEKCVALPQWLFGRRDPRSLDLSRWAGCLATVMYFLTKYFSLHIQPDAALPNYPHSDSRRRKDPIVAKRNIFDSDGAALVALSSAANYFLCMVR
jgi:hypothetical protein